MAIVSRKNRPDDFTVDLTHEKQFRLAFELLFNNDRWCVMRWIVRKYFIP